MQLARILRNDTVKGAREELQASISEVSKVLEELIIILCDKI
jgi:hypothetical protein